MDATLAARSLRAISGPGVIIRRTAAGGRPAAISWCRTGHTYFCGSPAPIPARGSSIFSTLRQHPSSWDIAQQHMVTVRVIGLTGARFRDGQPSLHCLLLVMPQWHILSLSWIQRCVHSFSRVCMPHIFCYTHNQATCLGFEIYCVLRITCLFVAVLCGADLSHFNFIGMGSLLL